MAGNLRLNIRSCVQGQNVHINFISINICKLGEDNERDRPTDTVTLYMDVLSFQRET